MILQFFLFVFSKQNQPKKDFYRPNKNFLSDQTITTEHLDIESTLTLVNTSFISIKTNSRGGAIYMDISNSMLYGNKVQNCIFDSCSSGWGGAFYIKAKIMIKSLFENCTFSRNECSEFGGSLYISNSENTFKNSVFKNNTIKAVRPSGVWNYNLPQQLHGGAIYMISCTFSITNLTFSNNMIKHFELLPLETKGSAVYAKNSVESYENCTFSNNGVYATIGKEYFEIFGGAILSEVPSYERVKATIINCVFKNNNFFINRDNFYVSKLIIEGGDIYASSQITEIKNCSFITTVFDVPDLWTKEDYVIRRGGIYSTVEIEIENCEFVNNLGYGENFNLQGGCLYATNKIKVISCKFINNSIYTIVNSTCDGGAIKLKGKSNFLNCSFINNTAFSGFLTKGGGIYLLNNESYIVSCKFINNNANIGGDIFLESSDLFSLIILNSIFERNSDEILTINSSIYFYMTNINQIIHSFINNSFYYNSNSNNIVVFDGFFENNSPFKCNFDNNCLYPYKEQYFKISSLKLYDSNGVNLINFENAFNFECKYDFIDFNGPTNTFSLTNSNKVNQSNKGTVSKKKYKSTIVYIEIIIFSIEIILIVLLIIIIVMVIKKISKRKIKTQLL